MKTMKLLVLMLAPLMLCAETSGPEKKNEEEKAFSFRWTGFVKTDYWIDSRTVVAAREDLFLLYPARVMPDFNGKDIHGDPVFNFSAITSRLATYIDGPDAFGAKVSGLIEADFSGVTEGDINGFRLRHAYMQLQWERWGLMLGQWWHPLFATDVVPTVVSLNTGAPFQPFIRNPQATLTYRSGNSRWLFSMIAQRDNASDGPMGPRPDYLRNATLPNVHLQWTRTHDSFTAGLAADYKVIRPRTIDQEPGTWPFFYMSQTMGTYAFMAYGRYRQDKLDIKAKTIYGQNLSEHLMLGGYAESFNPQTGTYTYTPMNHLASWANVLYGENVVAGLFLGYGVNFGASGYLVPPENYGATPVFYGRGHDIAYVYRISPSVTVYSGRLAFCGELEYTAAAYGAPDTKGKVRNHHETANWRLLFTALYFF